MGISCSDAPVRRWSTKLAALMLGPALLVGATALAPTASGADGGGGTGKVQHSPGIVFGGGDEVELPFSGGTVASLTIGARRTPKGLVVGQVAQTNVQAEDNKDPGDEVAGSFEADVTCLEVVGNQAFVTGSIRHADGFWAAHGYDAVEYVLTDNRGSAPDTVRGRGLHTNVVTTHSAASSKNPCGVEAQQDFALAEGDIVVLPG
jgi:hypothetical protein